MAEGRVGESCARGWAGGLDRLVDKWQQRRGGKWVDKARAAWAVGGWMTFDLLKARNNSEAPCRYWSKMGLQDPFLELKCTGKGGVSLQGGCQGPGLVIPHDGLPALFPTLPVLFCQCGAVPM